MKTPTAPSAAETPVKKSNDQVNVASEEPERVTNSVVSIEAVTRTVMPV